jgi:ATP-dependent Lhr-like helicase
VSGSSPVFDWFQRRYGVPTPAQAGAWPAIAAGENVLIASPTGTGKTFAAFLAVLDRLEQLSNEPGFDSGIHCIYVSPLRALAYDLEKNLNEPLREIWGTASPIRVELRTGDTPAAARARQRMRPPHLLLTTPESLCLLLSQEQWLVALGHVRWMIVDEIHALAENKRGAHLALSIERLEDLRRSSGGPRLQRIGLSATVAPLSLVGNYLAGTGRDCRIIDATAAKKIELRVHTPLRKDPYPAAGYTGQRLIGELAALVRKYRTTLVFTNTRSGAEGAAFWLREAAPEIASQIECHHASLDRDLRQSVEDRLKKGELRAVVCSTSLELGIDIGSIDLVVMLSTPKGVSKALQRTGRSGHNIHEISRGILMATNMNDLVESCATALLARARHLDDVRIPDAPLDILAQHLVSMGCTRPWRRQEALALVRSAFPYRHLQEKDFNDVLDYLAGGGAALRRQYSELFGKIELDDVGFHTRAGKVRREFLQNVGVIPSVGMVRVRLRKQVLGSVEESFMRQVNPGDVFVLAGRPVRLEKISGMDAWVARATNAIPTVPRWNANKMPLSNNVAQEIIRFRAELRERVAADEHSGSHIPWIARRLDCGIANARIVHRMYLAQHRISEIPGANSLLIEELLETRDPSHPERKSSAPHARHYFFHAVIGRTANDAIARVLTARLSRRRGGNAIATPHDYGFVLTVAPSQYFTADELPELLSPEGFESELNAVLSRSDLLKYHFRNAAQTGLMVYRNYFGEQKPVRKLQWSAEVIFHVLQQHEPDHVLLREARRDSLQTFLDAESACAYLRRLEKMPLHLRTVDRVPPLSFAMYATRIKEALLVEDPRETMERLFHLWWEEAENG